jgi:hypothetical protein
VFVSFFEDTRDVRISPVFWVVLQYPKNIVVWFSLLQAKKCPKTASEVKSRKKGRVYRQLYSIYDAFDARLILDYLVMKNNDLKIGS